MSSAWSLLSLSEVISSLGDPSESIDLDAALERLAETLDVEIAAICSGRGVEAKLGFSPTDRPDDLLLELAGGTEGEIVFPGLGAAWVLRAPLVGDGGQLVLVRTAGYFTADEVGFVRAIGRVLGMAIGMRSALAAERNARQDLERRVADNRRLVGQLRERQGLLDRLFRIQKSISHRLPTQDVLDAITEGARDLLGVAQSSIRLLDPSKNDTLVLVSAQGVDPDVVDQFREIAIGDRIPAEVIEEGRLVVRYDVDDLSLMSAAITVEGAVVGCLSVGDPRQHRFSPPEQEALLALAQHASLALQDARASDAMRHALDRERHRAEHDPLTSLPNRATVRAELASRLAPSNERPVVVLFVDLDRFKLANDTLGHAFGDAVLTVVADRLRTTVRETDIVGRLSGDEFVVICDGFSEVGAIEFAERLQSVISQPIASGGVNHVITASVGIAAASGTDTADQVLANADLAMYRAKQRGRARIDVFDRELRELVEERISIGQGLRRAIANDEFVVYLQPVVELPTRRVGAYEALVRWEHPTRGTLAPDAFVPPAEELGLIDQIDRMVVHQTVRLLAAYPNARPIAVNLSARTFADPDLVTWLAAEIETFAIEPDRLTIEVTETVLMDQTGTTARQIEALRSLGVPIMIDDFGTGYSSLSYLQTFSVDGVKIDRSFVARLGEDRRADAIVAAVFHMAEALELVVVAEGIETDTQSQRMVALRDAASSVPLLGQGYLFGRPAEGETRLAGFFEVPGVGIAG